jgi:hypothetical protein
LRLAKASATICKAFVLPFRIPFNREDEKED